MSRQLGYLSLATVLLLLSVTLRVWGLDRDSPSVDVLPDEATWTDEGTLAVPALAAIRGDTALSSVNALPAGIHPFYNEILYTAFQLAGPGRIQGRLVSLVFGVLGLLALAQLGRLIWSESGSLLALALGGTSFFSIVFDRLILTEGPLVALLSTVALLGVQAQSTLGGLATGIALGLVAVGIKLHALALLPALALFYVLRRRRVLLPFLIGVAVVLVAWQIFWIPQVPSYTGYIQDRFTEPQMGLAGPFQVMFQVFLAGLPGYFLPYQIALLFFACLEVLAFLLAPRRWLRESNDLVLLALLWLPCALAGPSLFRYMPTRYFIPAFPSLALLAIAGIKRLWTGESLPEASGKVRFAIGLGMGLFFLFQVAPPLPLFGTNASLIPVLGLPAPLLFYWLTTRTRPGLGLSKNVRIAVLIVLLSFHFLLQAGLYWAGVIRSRADVAQIAANLTAELPSNAILTGRMAGSVALFSDQRAVPMYHQIDSQFIDGLAKYGPVWVLVLQGDEKLVTRQVQDLMMPEGVFPIGYSHESQYLKAWRYTGK